MCRVKKSLLLQGLGHSGYLERLHIPYMYIVIVKVRARLITLLCIRDKLAQIVIISGRCVA
jgi:hypothetical protein